MYVINLLFESWTIMMNHLEKIDYEYNLYNIEAKQEIFYVPEIDIYRLKIEVCN